MNSKTMSTILLVLVVLYLTPNFSIASILSGTIPLPIILVIVGIVFFLLAKRERIERYKEELDDYRGWTEPEAAYRVAGIVRRLKKERVENFDLSDLHLGKLQTETIIKQIFLGINGRSLQGADLRRANLQGADLLEANLQEADLGLADLQGADLYEANLQGANLGSANLQGADLRRTNLQEANLLTANLQGASLFEANLQGAKLRGTNLQGVDLRRANLSSANLQEASLWETKVNKLDWIEKLKKLNVKGREQIAIKYYVDPKEQKDENGNTCYLIKEKPKENC